MLRTGIQELSRGYQSGVMPHSLSSSRSALHHTKSGVPAIRRWSHAVWGVAFAPCFGPKWSRTFLSPAELIRIYGSKVIFWFEQNEFEANNHEFLYGSLVHLNHGSKTGGKWAHWCIKGVKDKKQRQIRIHETLTLSISNRNGNTSLKGTLPSSTIDESVYMVDQIYIGDNDRW